MSSGGIQERSTVVKHKTPEGLAEEIDELRSKETISVFATQIFAPDTLVGREEWVCYIHFREPKED